MNKKILHGSFIVIFVYGASQLLRLSSNLIITRILDPEMFGIVGLITVIMTGLIMFTDVGLNSAIIRSPHGLNKDFLNTAWSVQVVRGWLIFLILSLIAAALWMINRTYPGFLQGVYQEPMLPLYMVVVSLSAIISGYCAMSPAIAIRNSAIGRLQFIELASQFIGAVFMILYAWKYKTIWALVFTPIIISFSKTILIQYVFKDTHRFEVKKKHFEEIQRYGKWILLSSLLTFLSNQGDRLLFGYYLTPQILGFYTIAFFLTTAFIDIIKRLSQNILFPLFCRVKNDDHTQIYPVYYKYRLIFDAIAGTITGFLFITGPYWVNLLYDNRYAESGIFLSILSMSILGHSISSVGLECLSAIGQTKISAKIMFIRSFLLILGIPVVFTFLDLHAVIFYIAIIVYLSLPILYHELAKNNLFNFKQEIRTLIFPLLGYLMGITFNFI